MLDAKILCKLYELVTTLNLFNVKDPSCFQCLGIYTEKGALLIKTSKKRNWFFGWAASSSGSLVLLVHACKFTEAMREKLNSKAKFQFLNLWNYHAEPFKVIWKTLARLIKRQCLTSVFYEKTSMGPTNRLYLDINEANDRALLSSIVPLPDFKTVIISWVINLGLLFKLSGSV